jgi:tetratricopeptide (TPR) repeat protein
MDSTLRGLSSIAQRMGELRKSISYLNELMNLYCEDEGSEVLAHTYQYRGMILTKRGDFQDATKDFDKSLELYDQLSDLFGRARVLINLGQTLLLTGETTRAHKIFRESLVISQKLGNPKGEAISLGNLAQIMVLKGNFSEAHNMLGTDLKISRQINDHFGVVFAQLYKASAYFWERKFKKSLDLFKECNATATKRKLYQPMVSSGIGIVRVLLETGEIAAAVTALDEIEKQMEHREDPIIEARFQAVNAELEIAQGKYSKATRCLNTAYLTFEKTGLIFEQALCLLKEAKIALAQGAKETYVTRLGDARSLFMKMEADYFFRNANHFLGPDFSDTSNNEEDNQ